MEGMLGLGLLTLALFLKSFIQGADPEAGSAIVAHEGMPFYNMIFGAIHTTPFLTGSWFSVFVFGNNIFF